VGTERREVMVESVLLAQGKTGIEEKLRTVSLANAKQLVYGRFGTSGTILHVAANSEADLQKAVLDFSSVPGVSSVMTLAVSK
jgi:hypothetical protein